ncbi:MAG: homogentisate phytyltransferase [Leptolyngbyaceae cyanobacterium bins.302]|nr:homogentisate phytyltransferase [Leptolyngbyaceae cyanobacterium bins.302]
MHQVSSKSTASPPKSPLYFTKTPFLWLRAFWKFSRPHTIIGTSLSVLALYAIVGIGKGGWGMGVGGWNFTSFVEALLETARVFLLPAPYSLLPALLACLCGNVYIVGLNQLEDVEIDRINKPHLPIASGEFSRRQGFGLVAILGILALGIAGFQSPYLLAMVTTSLLIGTAYSLPPIRLKRFPFWASVCILSVRGLVVNLGLFLHFNRGLPISAPVWTLTLFILVFTIAIALFKDIPDAEGDRQYHISTFTLKLGQRRVFNITRWVVTSCYLGLILAAFSGLPGIHAPLLIITHLALILLFWWRSFKVNLQDKHSITRFYQFIWKLFFLEYILFPLVCLPA